MRASWIKSALAMTLLIGTALLTSCEVSPAPPDDTTGAGAGASASEPAS